MAEKLSVNPIACSAHGVCAELLPELISLDEWGYPILAGQPVPVRLVREARRAVANCPALALRLTPVAEPSRSTEAAADRYEKRSQKELRGGAY